MDSTASSFTLRKNAKRAAEAMIRKGTAPTIDYGIELGANGRFEIVWKTAKAVPAIHGVEIQLAEASADEPAAALPTEASPPASAATERATSDAAPQPVSEAEAASQRAPAAAEPATTEAAPQRAAEVEAASQPAPATTEHRRGIERAAAERMATRHPRDGAQAQIVA